MEPSIFLDFSLPNAATWFYFSLLLTVAIFFQFSRPFSLRNLDLLTLFLLVPGFLLLQEARKLIDEGNATRGHRELIVGYAWLLAGSLYWFVRTVFDLTLVRRPVANPNLTTSGLGWLGIALFICLGAVAVRNTGETAVRTQVGIKPKAIEQLQDRAAAAVEHTQGESKASSADVRFWVERSLALLCHLAVAVGLLMIGWKNFREISAGVALSTLYLLLPYTAYHVGQFHLVWPAAFITWAVYFYRRPLLSGWLLGLAAGSTFVTLLLFPLWLGFYMKRGAVRFATSFGVALLLSVGVLAAVLWWDGFLASGLNEETVAEWLPWKRTKAESLWTGVHGAYRLPIFVLFVGFVGVIAVWPSPKNLSHLVALSAAVLLGVQFWHADRGGAYVLWYLPLVLMMVFRPNLTGHVPPPIEPGSVFQWAGAAWERVRGKKPVPTTTNELAV